MITLQNFANWLSTQDPNTEFEYNDPYICAAAAFYEAQGMKNKYAVMGIAEFGKAPQIKGEDKWDIEYAAFAGSGPSRKVTHPVFKGCTWVERRGTYGRVLAQANEILQSHPNYMKTTEEQ
jgi:hypothetical protein